MISAIRLIDAREHDFDKIGAEQLVPRASVDVDSAMAAITPLLADVRLRGEVAVVEVTKDRDGVDPSPLRVSADEIKDAVANLDGELRDAIQTAISRVRKVSEANLPRGTSVALGQAASVSQRWQPVDSVGLYVPGGKAVYPSSVVMNVVPAQVAGVPRLVVASPAQKDFGGRPHPTVLATAGLLGVDEVYSMGGPAAIAAFAFGLQTGTGERVLEPVRLVTGPGNIYVTAAKRALRGSIGIDAEAGTTEILIIADSTADPRLVAYDLVSQAEHDEAAASVLVTDSPQLAAEVQSLLPEIASRTHHSSRVATALSGQQSAIVLVSDLQSAIKFANQYGTEHLEIQTEHPQDVAGQISNAGAIFLGSYSPVSLGDYLAGSSHVLPTGGATAFSSGLGVHTFLRAQQVISYQEPGLAEVASQIAIFAKAEGLPAHGEAVVARFPAN